MNTPPLGFALQCIATATLALAEVTKKMLPENSSAHDEPSLLAGGWLSLSWWEVCRDSFTIVGTFLNTYGSA